MSDLLPLPDVSSAVLAASLAIVLVGYTIFGATGFGSSVISVPGLAHFFPLTFTVPLVTVTDAFAATSTALRELLPHSDVEVAVITFREFEQVQ